MRNPRIRRLGSSLILSGLLFAGTAALAPAAHAAEPKLVEGNPNIGGDNGQCKALNPDADWIQFSVNGAPEGDHKVPNSDIVITISDVKDNQFNWTSTLDMDAVFVKGGDNGNLYLYPGSEDKGDSGLHAPVNENGKQDEAKYYGISHLTFCWDLPGQPDQTPECVDRPEELCGGQTPPEQPPADQPPVENPPVDQPPAEQPPADLPPVEVPQGQPPVDQPKVDQPKVDQKVEVLGENLVQGGELPRTGSAPQALIVLGGVLLALGLTTKAASRLASQNG